MRSSFFCRLTAFSALLTLVAVAGCGSSATTSTSSPTPLTRCALTASGGGTVPAVGGSGTVSVSAARECAWTASTDGQWLSIKVGATGQGDGTVEFTAASNPDPVLRTGAIVLNEKRVDVTQAAGECVISLQEREMSFSQAGGTGRAEVRASSQLCVWKAESNASWILLHAEGNGKGTAPLQFDVMPATGVARTGEIRVAGQRLTVTQSADCAYSLNPSSHRAESSGGSGSITVETGAFCSWTATSNVSWLTFSTGRQEGPGTVTFTVLPNEGARRTGTARVAGQTFTVTQDPMQQAPACSFEISPTQATAPEIGGPGTVAVVAAAGCPWQAATAVEWIQIVSGSSGNGSGQVTYVVAPAVGAPRSGTLIIAGQTFTVNQASLPAPVPPPTSTCTYRVEPLLFEVSSGERDEEVEVETSRDCPWTATSNASWIRIESRESDTGDGEVRFEIERNRSAVERTGTLSVAGATVTVRQRGR